MKIAVLIVTYNGQQWIKDCLNSCLEFFEPSDIFIVDNCSTDNTRDYFHSEMNNIFLEKNLGFGGGNNLGMDLIFNDRSYDVCFLLNQDAYITQYDEALVIELLTSYSDSAILSPYHFANKGDTLDHNFKLYLGQSTNIEGTGLFRSEFINAAAWFLPKRSYAKYGGFDEIFFHTGEDVNYCHRLVHAGEAVIVTPQLQIIHDRSRRQKSSIYRYTNLNTRLKIHLFNPNINMIKKFIKMTPLIAKYGANVILGLIPTKKFPPLFSDLKKSINVLGYYLSNG